jgi:hypothetical protein
MLCKEQHIKPDYNDDYADNITQVLGRASVTRHIRRTGCIRRVADAQLPVFVFAPALDPAPAHNRAGVRVSQGDGDGGNAWQLMYGT